MSKRNTVLLKLFSALLLCRLAAPAQGALKAGATLTYTVVAQAKLAGGHLPTQLYNSQPGLVRSISIAVNSIDSDGVAQVHVTSQKEMPASVKAVTRAAVEKMGHGEFEAMMTPEGALVIPQDAQLQASDAPSAQGLSTRQYRDKIVAQANDPAYEGRMAAFEVSQIFVLPNLVALSVSKRPSITVGDHWQVTSNIERKSYDLTITGKDTSNGHEVVLVSATGKFDTPSGSSSVDAQLRYDPVNHLVVSMHSDTSNHLTSMGMTQAATYQMDLKP